MKISELLAAIGDDKIFVQNLQQNATGFTNDKRGGLITFATEPGIVANLMACSLTDDKPEKVGLILWLPGDEARRLTAAPAPSETPTGSK